MERARHAPCFTCIVVSSWCILRRVLGRRGVLSDYVAALRGTLAVRRARGQVGIELAFAGTAMIVAFVGFYTVFVQSETAESAAEARSALGLPPADDSDLTIGDGDGFVVTDGQGGSTDTDADAPGAPATDGPGTTGPDGTPVETADTGILPSGTTSPDGTPGHPAPGPGVGAGEGEEGTQTSLPPSSTTDPGSSSTSTPPTTTDPGNPSTTPTTTPPNVLDAIIDLLGL